MMRAGDYERIINYHWPDPQGGCTSPNQLRSTIDLQCSIQKSGQSLARMFL